MKKRKILRLLAVLTMVLTMVLHTSNMTTAETKDTWISSEYVSYIKEISADYGICPELIMAIIESESSGKADAVNGICVGLMQINAPFHRDRMVRLGVTDLYEPEENILVGVDYLMELAAEYEDISLVLDIYNGNSKAFANYENGILSDYAKGILERAEELERIHGK